MSGRHSGEIEKYVYMVVVAGSAGCIVANRLSADPNRAVLMIEAGGKNDKLALRPVCGDAKHSKNRGAEGQYRPTPQKPPRRPVR